MICSEELSVFGMRMRESVCIWVEFVHSARAAAAGKHHQTYEGNVQLFTYREVLGIEMFKEWDLKRT